MIFLTMQGWFAWTSSAYMALKETWFEEIFINANVALEEIICQKLQNLSLCLKFFEVHITFHLVIGITFWSFHVILMHIA